MNKGAVIMLTIIIAIVSVTIYIYLNSEEKQSQQYSNITIYAEENKQRIRTGYIINHSLGVIEGNTSQSYERIKIPRGIATIQNKNIDGQSYFIDTITKNITKDTERIKLNLRIPKEIEVKINDSKPIGVNIYSIEAKNIKFCLSWSLNYIFVKAKDFQEIDKIENWDRCYDTNITLQDSNETILVDYTKFGTPTDNDYIKILLINEDPKISSKIVNIK